MGKRIHYIFLTFCVVVLSLSAVTRVFSEEKVLIKAGDPFPQIVFNAPEDPKDAAYLGVPGDKSFTIKDISADLVLVEARFGKSGRVDIVPPLFLKKSNGDDTDAAKEIFSGAFSANLMKLPPRRGGPTP